MNILKKILISFALVAVLSTTGYAIEYNLRADYTTKTMPDSNIIPMWGFAIDSNFGALDGQVTVPGPLLTVPVGDPNLIIHLDNNLNVPVSIVIDGQNTVMIPARNPDGRVRSFTHETEPGNIAPVDYVWTNFRPGTYIYQSGTHPAVQVQMGLYGGITKDFNVGQAYQGVDYSTQVPLFFSEIDPALHQAVSSNNYGPGKAMTSTIDYDPKYFLINGEPFVEGQAAIPVGLSGGGTLLRLFNMGIETRCPLLQGSYMTLVAEDGQKYTYPKEQYVVSLPAGKTLDAVVVFPSDGTYPIYDRRLGLTNAQATEGGMLAYLEVSPGGPVNVAPVINSVTATPASILDTQTSQLLVIATDTDGPLPLSYNWIVPAGAGNVDNPLIANPVYTPPIVAGTQTFMLTVEVSDGLDTVSSTVDVNVTHVNAAPVINSVTATPASILDTQTSQLSVSATDADAGPSALSYNWIVPAGAGNVDNPLIANPIYTPPDLPDGTSQTFILTVEVSDGSDMVSQTVTIIVNDPIIFRTTFNAGPESFVYSDDTFRGTSQPAYARGRWLPVGSWSLGGLEVTLGGINNSTVLNMSGGWRRSFTLPAETSINISFWYRLRQTPNYENNEYSDAMLSIDGVLYGAGANDYLERIFGNGNGGGNITTGWHSVTKTLTLPAGNHTIIIGGYNNRKDANNEFTTVQIDNVVVTRN
jgi:FtsP/CotA-like multicopper oxidase with cupredoxin domain